MNFIFVSLQRINTDRESTSTSLAKELSKNHKVLYVNPPIDRKNWLSTPEDVFVDNHKQLIKSNKAGLEQIDRNLWVLHPKNIIESINWIPYTFLFNIFNKRNNKIFSAEILKAISVIGFKDFIVINDKDMFRSFYLKEYLKPQFYIYLDRDYTLGFKYWQRHGFQLEPKLMAKSDAIVCNSSDFTKKAKKINKNSFYIENGANLGLFNPDKVEVEPIDLIGLERPLIGYVGALTTTRLDLELFVKIAKSLNKGTLVLIGPQDDNFKRSELHHLEHVKYFDKKDTKEIPAYVSNFDVCINPQILNEITLGNFPLKIVEYLAMGKPVVATATNTMKEVFSEQVYLAVTQEEFIKNIQMALEKNDPLSQEKRINFSKRFSWTNVTQNLLRVIDQLKDQKQIY